jgi:hypothetical protein
VQLWQVQHAPAVAAHDRHLCDLWGGAGASGSSGGRVSQGGLETHAAQAKQGLHSHPHSPPPATHALNSDTCCGTSCADHLCWDAHALLHGVCRRPRGALDPHPHQLR